MSISHVSGRPVSLRVRLRDAARCAAFLAVACVGMAEARGGFVSSVSTGATSSGALLADGARDAGYSLIQSADPNYPGPSTFVVSQGAFPFPPWYADSATSKWIAPYANGGISSPAGTYVYETTFSLAGFDPTTAKIAGTWATDNEGVSILLNGVATGFTTGTTSYTSPSAFSIVDGTGSGAEFLAGMNTLEFIVHNDGGTSGNPTGLRVDAVVTAAVPEPSSIILTSVGGLMGWGFLRRRKPAVA